MTDAFLMVNAIAAGLQSHPQRHFKVCLSHLDEAAQHLFSNTSGLATSNCLYFDAACFLFSIASTTRRLLKHAELKFHNNNFMKQATATRYRALG